MTEISLRWHSENTKFVKQGENSLAYKKRLGHHPLTLDSHCTILLKGGKINRNWKAELTERLKRVKFFRQTPCTITVGSQKFEIHGVKDEYTLANNIANIILHLRHNQKNKYGAKPYLK